jgi:3-hydroxyacyl-CoA dehydrogenase
MSNVKEQVRKGVIAGGVIAAYIIQQTKAAGDDVVMSDIQEILNEIDLNKEVNEQDLKEAAFDVLEIITEATPTKVDDAALATIHGGVDMVTGGSNIGLWDMIKGAIQINKAKRQEKRNGLPGEDVAVS